jgi:hypothetical protein
MRDRRGASGVKIAEAELLQVFGVPPFGHPWWLRLPEIWSVRPSDPIRVAALGVRHPLPVEAGCALLIPA